MSGASPAAYAERFRSRCNHWFARPLSATSRWPRTGRCAAHVAAAFATACRNLPTTLGFWDGPGHHPARRASPVPGRSASDCRARSGQLRVDQVSSTAMRAPLARPCDRVGRRARCPPALRLVGRRRGRRDLAGSRSRPSAAWRQSQLLGAGSRWRRQLPAIACGRWKREFSSAWSRGNGPIQAIRRSTCEPVFSASSMNWPVAFRGSPSPRTTCRWRLTGDRPSVATRGTTCMRMGTAGTACRYARRLLGSRAELGVSVRFYIPYRRCVSALLQLSQACRNPRIWAWH